MAFKPKIINGGNSVKGKRQDGIDGKSIGANGYADISGNLGIAFFKALETRGFRVCISESQERADPKAKGKEGRLAKWDKDHWRILDGVEGKWLPDSFDAYAARSGSIVAIASKFSKATDPSKHSFEKASESLVNLARQDLPQVPDAPGFSVIPTVGAWLRPVLLNEEGVPEEWKGRIRVMAPDQTFGVLRRVPVDLALAEGQEFYEPASVPSGSLFARFLASSLPDLGVRQAVQEFLAYGVLDEGPNLQIAQIWIGGGGNGKGEMQKLASALHRKTFVFKPNSKSDFSLDGVEEASLILTDEWPKRIEGIEELKSVVGDGLMKINRKGRSLYEARVRGKMLINSNHVPIWSEVNDAIDRRFQMIPWNQKPAEIIDHLAEKILRDEFKIFLDWILEGLIRLINRRSTRRPNGFAFEALAVSEDLKRQSRIESDSVLRFLDESGSFLSNSQHAIKSELYKSYANWASDTGTKLPCGEVEFWKRAIRTFPEIRSWRQRQGKDLFRVSNLVLPEHSPAEALLREAESMAPPANPASLSPEEAESQARSRWAAAKPEGASLGSYAPEFDSMIPHWKSLLRALLAEGAEIEVLDGLLIEKIRSLGGNPPDGRADGETRRRMVEILID